MKLKINGKDEDVFNVNTLKELIDYKKLNIEHIVIEYNMNIVNKEDVSSIFITDNDAIEIVSFVGGG